MTLDLEAEPEIHLSCSKGQTEQELRLELGGRNIDQSVVNALRRTILLYIPIYAFHRNNIVIDHGKSYHMYNSDLLFNQIETLPIFDVSEDEHHIEMSVQFENKGDDYHFLSTHDVRLEINGREVKNYHKRPPISILVLKPGEKISFKAIANRDIAKNNAIYEATTNVYFVQKDRHQYVLIYETLGQLHQNTIFTRACQILIERLKQFKKSVKAQKISIESDKPVEIRIVGEEHTLGNLVTSVLQKLPGMIKAGYTLPHPFHDEVLLVYQTRDHERAIEILIAAVDYLVRIFQIIREKFLECSDRKSVV